MKRKSLQLICYINFFICKIKKCFINTAAFGSHSQNLLLIARNPKPFRQFYTNFFSAAAKPSGNCNDKFLHLVLLLTIYKSERSFYSL